MAKKISYVVIFGDSLSDRGTANQAYLWGLIPLVRWATLTGAPKGQFTNGHVWSHLISTLFINDLFINEFKKKPHFNHADLADSIIAQEKKVKQVLQQPYSLDHDIFVKYKGHDFVRSYAEGGLSAASYTDSASPTYAVAFYRKILPILADKRAQLLTYDETHKLSKKHIDNTVVIDWTGANDFLTVNEKPTEEIANKVLEARKQNIEELVKKGYKHFILFNLPDLSLTPRFQNLTGPNAETERSNVHAYINYFNRELEKLKTKFPECTIEIFDINKIFTNIYKHPETYGFEEAKLKKSYKDSKAANAKGYMFWDDIHPIMLVQVILAYAFHKIFHKLYELVEPEEEIVSADSLQKQLIAAFMEKPPFQDRLDFFSQHIKAKSKTTLKETLQNAYKNNKVRTKEILRELGWVSESGEVLLNSPELKEAISELEVAILAPV